MQSNKTVLVFGCGDLQRSIIDRAHRMGLFVVGIDPCADACCRDDVDAFEVVGGQDFAGTCAVVQKYAVNAIVTAATDKPLVMMARIAEKYGFPFYSPDTARWSTDKFLMKERFESGGIPHAKGRPISRVEEAEGLAFPVIVKPRDNSGSRGVKLCRNREELAASIDEARGFSRLGTVLVEEFIAGQEYSIEAFHYGGKSEVIQFTEKKTTAFPYNVELGHKQPAELSDGQKDAIRDVVQRIGVALQFENCPSHTELKINGQGIFVIETSPRLGGGYITSTLVPLSTGINMEDQLLHIALGEPVDTQTGRVDRAAGVAFFEFPEGVLKTVDPAISRLEDAPGVHTCKLQLQAGDRVNKIKSGLDRYGYIICQAPARDALDKLLSDYTMRIRQMVDVIPFSNQAGESAR